MGGRDSATGRYTACNEGPNLKDTSQRLHAEASFLEAYPVVVDIIPGAGEKEASLN